MNFENAGLKRQRENKLTPRPIEVIDEDLMSDSELPVELESLKIRMNQARKVLRGESVYGVSLCGDIRAQLENLEEMGIEAPALTAEANEMLTFLPIAEFNNLVRMSEASVTSGDLIDAGKWLEQASNLAERLAVTSVVADTQLKEIDARISAIRAMIEANEL